MFGNGEETGRMIKPYRSSRTGHTEPKATRDCQQRVAFGIPQQYLIDLNPGPKPRFTKDLTQLTIRSTIC